jgi:hypothetical protein
VWTRYGAEAGESVECILRRKEAERLANSGVFLWGIGSSVAPAINALVKECSAPPVIFTPMLSAPRSCDVNPQRVLCWSRATTLSGAAWDIPCGSTVTSKAAVTPRKHCHYALVCYAPEPLSEIARSEIVFSSLEVCNLTSGKQVGASQVTAVVARTHLPQAGSKYRVAFQASLVYPFFVRLSDPVCVPSTPSAAATCQHDAQKALWVQATPAGQSRYPI